MKRRAKVTIIAVLLGLIVIVALFGRSFFHGRKSQQAKAFPTASNSRSTGGQILLLETFSPEGHRYWRLELDGVIVATDRTLEGRGVSAEYFGTTPSTTLAAGQLAYRPQSGQLVFQGGIRLHGPLLALTAPQLVWDERTGSFAVSGGYTLTRKGAVLQGENLWASEGFREIRALGAVKLRTTPIGGGAE